MRLLRFALFTTTLLAATLLRAQAVHWEAGDSALGNAVQLVFEDCEPDGDPQLPALPNATLSLAGRSSSVNIVNMSVSRSLVLSYVVQSRRGGPLQIPAFTVKTNKGPVRVAAFNGAASSVSAESVATSQLIPARTSVWAGEVFDLTYKITAARRNNPQFDPSFAFDWTPAPLVTEEWGKPGVSETTADGQRSIVVNVSTRAYAKNAGSVRLEPVHQVVHVQTGAVGFGLFSQARMEPVSITSDQPTLEVRPLPTAPAGFNGAVGQFKLTSNVVPKEAAVGEPVTWTLELSGTGNWPDIPGLPARDVSKDFQVVQPKAKRTPADGKLFDATLSEDVVLVPTKPGTYTVGPVVFTYFNPQSGRYETARTDRTTIKISPAATSATAAIPAPAGSDAAKGGPTATATESLPHTSPAAPAGIPRDPLPGTGYAALPLSTRALVTWLLAPIAALVVFWFALACRRAARTDPTRPRREARARLAALLRAMKEESPGVSAADATLERRLLAWQRDTGVLFGIPHAAPSAAALVTAAGSSVRIGAPRPDSGAPTNAAEWTRLWREADGALYGVDRTLPADWVARAETALTAKTVPAFNPARLFLPENLLAFVASVALLLVILGHGLHAASASEPARKTDPAVAYRAGDFASAEKGWRELLAQRPTDWIARHNLSLALAQQDRVGEAAAQAAAAFVQHPNDPAVRWHFALTTGKAGFTPAPLIGLVKDGPAASVAALASPARWQRVVIVAAFVVAIALGWMLFNAYGARSLRQTWGAAALGALAVLTGVIAIFGLVSYGETADRRAVVTWETGTLRSIPTEADTTQKLTSLPAGSTAVVDKSFLGWERLQFTNGQTGWVRKEQVVPLWR